jgi:hypothetical protein
MQLSKRFIFHANATGVTARIRRPVDKLYDSQGVSSLPVSGGRSSHAVPGGNLDEYVSFGGITTHAQGDFQDPEPPKRGDYSNATATSVRAEVRDLRIMKRLEVGLLRANLDGLSAESGRQPCIRTSGNAIEGVKIDGHPLTVELDEGFFGRCDTKDGLGQAMKDDPQRKGQHCLEESGGVIYGSLVKEIRWAGAPAPGVTIDGHSVHIPDFGTVYFAELLVSEASRRLTMLRAHLGSPVGGEVTAGGTEDNGIYWPA